MSNLIILTVDDWVADRLERHAEAHGRTPGQEAKAILHEALGPPPAPRRRQPAIPEGPVAGAEANRVELNREARET